MSGTPSPSLALVVITHNSSRWLPAFFATWRDTLAASSRARHLHCRTIIADSGSSDDTHDAAARAAPAARLLPLGNLGYGPAANHAIAAAPDATHILLCNPDLTFPHNFAAAFLDPLAAQEPPFDRAACIIPRLMNPDGSTQPSVGRFFTIRDLIADQFRTREHRKYLHPQPTVAQPIDWAMAACLLLRKDAFDAVGGFDDHFFLYVEEVDLLRRLRNAGRESWFFPAAAVTHHSPNAARSPRPEVQRYAARGTLRYFAKHGSFLQLLSYRLLALLSRRLPPHEALAPRTSLLNHPTGP
ncbi:MAG TPA: glycosyltransferase family 2 protein [Phycisphaerae bacterium]|nr:glycosyltransferase family 2 protein [Phycisphaerae bacterium]